MKKLPFTVEDIFDEIHWQDSYYDLYPGYSEPIDENEETQFNTKENATNYALDLIGIFNDIYSEQEITIYRAIRVDNQNNIDMEYPGAYWSLYRDSAIQFGSHAGCNYLLTAKINTKDINWENTLKAFVEFTHMSDADDEWEINVAGNENKLYDLNVEKIKWKNG
jgi:hypothetical protein